MHGLDLWVGGGLKVLEPENEGKNSDRRETHSVRLSSTRSVYALFPGSDFKFLSITACRALMNAPIPPVRFASSSSAFRGIKSGMFVLASSLCTRAMSSATRFPVEESGAGTRSGIPGLEVRVLMYERIGRVSVRGDWREEERRVGTVPLGLMSR